MCTLLRRPRVGRIFVEIQGADLDAVLSEIAASGRSFIHPIMISVELLDD